MMTALATIIVICLMFAPFLSVVAGVVGGLHVGGLLGAIIGRGIGLAVTGMWMGSFSPRPTIHPVSRHRQPGPGPAWVWPITRRCGVPQCRLIV
jgi:hypothetical protein